MRKNVIKLIGILIIVLGITICLYPMIANKVNKNRMAKEIEEFIEEYENENIPILDSLKQEFMRYNEKLYTEGQKLVDAFSYETPDFNLSEYGYSENMVGYLDIPKMEITLPIYLGATKENLKKGATLLSQTSIPVGGNHTNAVIAAHRGMTTNEMFRNIQKLEIGDQISITNTWEKLTYKVSEIKIINPEDISEVLIQENRELVTLITCHPYRKNYQRYVVYAERIK